MKVKVICAAPGIWEEQHRLAFTVIMLTGGTGIISLHFAQQDAKVPERDSYVAKVTQPGSGNARR